MNSFPPIDPGALQAWLLVTAALFLKLFSNTVFQAAGRFPRGVVTTPEDARVFGRGKARVAADPPLAERASWAWENDLENIPIFLFLSLGLVLAGGDAGTSRTLFAVFFGTRIVHGYTLLRGIQPLRAITYFAGTAVCFILAIKLFLAA